MTTDEKIIRSFIQNFETGDYIRFEEPNAYPPKVRAQIRGVELDQDPEVSPTAKILFLEGQLSGEIRYVLMKDIVQYCINETRETKKKIGMWKQGLKE